MESENLTFDSLRMATLLLLHKRQQQLAIIMKTIFEPERPLIPNTRLDLNALDEGMCVAFFRFNKTQIEQLVEHFRIPSVSIVNAYSLTIKMVWTYCKTYLVSFWATDCKKLDNKNLLLVEEIYKEFRF
ncbi:hypothetical protein G9A89_023277 [Geosiphon pyriformis]|nr:hypothetical protein G9A89_023277 [Geosiphon pyriformis]